MKLLKTFLVALMFVFVGACNDDLTSDANASVRNEISSKYIYFFYQTTCPHCHHASAYIRQKYPRLKMVNVDVKDTSGYNLFLKCAQKFHLSQSTLGTPLICMGDHYIMGWSDVDAKRFDAYVQPFK